MFGVPTPNEGEMKRLTTLQAATLEFVSSIARKTLFISSALISREEHTLRNHLHLFLHLYDIHARRDTAAVVLLHLARYPQIE